MKCKRAITVLRTRTHVLDGELEDAFRRRWAAFQSPDVAMAKNRSFA